MNLLLNADSFSKLCLNAQWISLDVETTGLSFIKDTIIGIGICTDKGAGYLPIAPYRSLTSPLTEEGRDGEEIRKSLRHVFHNTYCIAWNAGFDIKFLARYLDCELPIQVVDPMVGLWLLNEEGALGLKDSLSLVAAADLPDWKSLVSKATELIHDEIEAARATYTLSAPRGLKGKYKEQAQELFPMRQASFLEVPIEWTSLYCTRDAVGAALMWFSYIRPSLEEEGLLSYFYSYEMPFLLCLAKMEQRGITIDEQVLEELEWKCRDLLAGLELELQAIVGRPLNPRSTKACSSYLFDESGFTPPSKLTASGAPSLDEASLKELHWKYGQTTTIFKILLDYREASKILSTYALGLRGEIKEGCIFTSFKQTGTATGRLSSSSPNLQNLPKKGLIRKAFVAREGYTLLKCDLSQAELRILADRTQDEALLDVYKENKDIHAETMERLGLTDRRLAKVLNFLVVYGGGPSTYQQNLLFDHSIYRSLEDCQKDINDFYKAYPSINDWKESVWKEARLKGYVKTLLGRKRRLPAINDNEDWSKRHYAERQAVNCLIQGDVSDIMKAVMILLDKELCLFDAHLLLQVHDELIIEAPIERVKETAHWIKNVMENSFQISVPVIVEIEEGENWSQTKPIVF